MAESDESDAEAYVVARFAEWAGDLEYSRRLYARVGGGMRYHLFPEQFDDPTDVIRFVSELRAARLGKSVSKEMLGMAKAVFGEDQQTKPIEEKKPVGLRPTTHLRAVVHRVGTRDFEMRAYLNRTDFEPRLYAKAAELADPPLEADESNTKSGRRQYRAPTGAWVIEGTLFQRVTVSYFGLIKSDGQWTRRELPRDSREILVPFQKLLDSLDPIETKA